MVITYNASVYFAYAKKNIIMDGTRIQQTKHGPNSSILKWNQIN